jgi:hypothetical protein
VTANAVPAGIAADVLQLQQTLVLPLDDRIALADPCIEARAIEKGNLAPGRIGSGPPPAACRRRP